MESTKTWNILKKSLAILLAFIMFTAIGTTVYAQHDHNEQQTDAQVKEFLEEKTSDYLVKLINRKNVRGMRETARRTRNPDGRGNRFEGLNEVALQMKDGSETSYIFSEDIKFVDNDGEIQYKDTSIITQNEEGMLSAGYEYTNGPNDYRIHFSTNPEKGVYINDNQNRITLTPIPISENIFGMKTHKIVEKEAVDVFEYPSVYGADTLLRYTPQLNALRKDIILNSYTGQNSFDFMLYTHGNTAEVAEDKSLHLINAAGDVVSSFMPVFAFDSFGGEYSEDETHYTENCHYELTELEDCKYKLTIVVDETFLRVQYTQSQLTP